MTVHWRSFELRPQDGPPISPEYAARIEAGRPRLYAIARAKYGLELNPGPWGIDSRPALVGAKFAEEQGLGDAYHGAIFVAYWQAGRSIADGAVLAELAAQIGLDPSAFCAALESPAFDDAVTQDIVQAQAFGLGSVPSLVFANHYLVVGAQPYPQLQQVIAQIQAQADSAGA